MTAPIKLMICFGTRPEAIKLAPLIALLREDARFRLVVCSTGQHRELVDQVLDVFSIVPDHALKLMREGQKIEEVSAECLTRIAALITKERPDRVIVQGDTTTAFAAALAAFFGRVRVGHVEAGLRTDNLAAPFPEEFNRRAIDLIADRLWVPTEMTAERARAEALPHQSVEVTGNTVIDAMRLAIDRIDAGGIAEDRLEALVPKEALGLRRLVLVTGHRRESFDGGIAAIASAVQILARRPDVHVLWPVHPNPNVREVVIDHLKGAPNVTICHPLDYLTFLAVLRRAVLAITDSGGIQEEAPWLEVPLLVTRENTERPEGVRAGVARLVRAETQPIIAAATEILEDNTLLQKMRQSKTLYGDGHASERIRDSLVAGHY